MIKNKNFTVLIIDDDSQIIDLVQMFLTISIPELNCVTAYDAQTALLKISNQEFDLIILDFKMPGKTGVELAAHLKKTLKHSQVPLILMSGALSQPDAIMAIENGVKDILVKPFSMKQLLLKVSPYFISFKNRKE